MKGDDIFVAFNAGKFDVPPRVYNYGYRSIYDMRSFEWEQHGFPYLAFLPTKENFSGLLWRRLAIDKDHFPAKKTFLNGRYLCRLDGKLVDAWVRLEDNLLRIIDILKASSNFRAIKFPPLPHSSKLKTAHEGMELLVKTALATRDRFVVLGAVLAFYISIQRNWATYAMPEYVIPAGEKGLWQGLWQEWMAEPITAGVHDQWLSFVGCSSICRRKIARRGVIIDYRKSEFSVLLPAMIAYGVPVILRIQERYVNCDVDIRLQDRILNTFRLFGHTKITAEEMNTSFRKYIPPSEIISQIRDRAAMDRVVDGFSFELNSAGSRGEQTTWLSTTLKAPVRDPEIETRVNFLARRKREHAARILRESAVERQRRIGREKDHASFQSPGANPNHTGTKVFIWERDGTSEFRSLLPHGQCDETWGKLKRSEMHYDSIHDEWDIWTDSAYFELGPPMNNEDFSGECLPAVADGEYIDNDIVLAPNVRADSFSRDVAACYGFTFEKTNGHFTGAYEIAGVFPLVERMQVWYGFNARAKFGRWDLVHVSNTLDVQHIRHLLRDSVADFVDNEQLPAIQQFVASLVEKVKMPGPFSDMRDRNISNFGNPGVRVLPSPYTAKEFEDPRSPLHILYSVEILDKDGRVQEDREQRHFFVWDATTALAIKRLPDSHTRSFSHIAEFLLQRGIPYVFAIPVIRLTLPTHDRRVPGLMSRWKDDVPDVLDFMAYLERCRELLCIDRLRKCLRYGGIIWRLARLFLDIYLGLDAPSSDALNQPQRLVGPQELVDDGISREEWLLLTGSFEVYDSE